MTCPLIFYSFFFGPNNSRFFFLADSLILVAHRNCANNLGCWNSSFCWAVPTICVFWPGMFGTDVRHRRICHLLTLEKLLFTPSWHNGRYINIETWHNDQNLYFKLPSLAYRCWDCGKSALHCVYRREIYYLQYVLPCSKIEDSFGHMNWDCPSWTWCMMHDATRQIVAPSRIHLKGGWMV